MKKLLTLLSILILTLGSLSVYAQDEGAVDCGNRETEETTTVGADVESSEDEKSVDEAK